MASASEGLPTPYAEAVLDAVAALPPGTAVAYGDVARAMGTGSARTVGMVLARWGGSTAWHRVVRADGTPAPGVRERQLVLLRAEGAPVAADGRVDLARARPPAGAENCQRAVLGSSSRQPEGAPRADDPREAP